MLSHSATVYVPSTQRDGVPVQDREVLLADVIQSVVGLCGGATVTQGVGYWQGEQGLAVEAVSLVTGYCDDLASIQGEFVAMCQSLAVQANQEAVSLALDNALEFVEALPVPEWWIDYIPEKVIGR